MTKRIITVAAILALACAAALGADPAAYENDFESDDSPQEVKGAKRVAEGKDGGHAVKVSSDKYYASLSVYPGGIEVVDGLTVSFDCKQDGVASSFGVRIYMGGKTKVALDGKKKKEGWRHFEVPVSEFHVAKMSDTKEKFEPGDRIDRLEIYGRGQRKAENSSHSLLVDNVRIFVKK